MFKNKKQAKKLALEREALRVLTPSELTAVVGGFRSCVCQRAPEP